jgi:hypothetical protein
MTIHQRAMLTDALAGIALGLLFLGMMFYF